MKVHNSIPLFLECLTRWKTRPTEKQFIEEYAKPLHLTVGDFFDDFYEVLLDLDWNVYRTHALQMNAEFEGTRFHKNLELVENLFGFKLEGEVFLLGTFESMDGFARFEHGRHKVYLGLDESFSNGKYLDVLTTHELTHVARESRPEVWQGFGLDPKMSRADFLEYQPVIEHVFGEGFSCVVSEILVPGGPDWAYTYQSPENMALIQKNLKQLDRAIKKEIQDPNGDYGSLYGIEPVFSQYVWGFYWVKKLLKERSDGDLKKLVKISSQEFLEDAMNFKLQFAN